MCSVVKWTAWQIVLFRQSVVQECGLSAFMLTNYFKAVLLLISQMNSSMIPGSPVQPRHLASKLYSQVMQTSL